MTAITQELERPVFKGETRKDCDMFLLADTQPR